MTSHPIASLWLALCACPVFAAIPCPWLNVATAAGYLGGEVQQSLTATSCEFSRPEAVLRIEVVPVGAAHTQCPAGSEHLKAIGNEAQACSHAAQSGWIAEQVTGRVRDQAFLVRVSAASHFLTPKDAREKARRIAEQVAGFLF